MVRRGGVVNNPDQRNDRGLSIGKAAFKCRNDTINSPIGNLLSYISASVLKIS